MEEFSKRIKDFLIQVANGKMKFTYFLTPEEQQVVSSMARKEDGVNVVFFGGFEGCERKRAVLFPSYMNEEKIIPNVAVFKINRSGIDEMTHPQILGSLMGLEIDRFIVGDILVGMPEDIYFATCSEFADFFFSNFTKVGRHNISLTNVTGEDITKEDKFEEFDIIVSSLRLDVVVKSIMNCARDKATNCLVDGHVKLNNIVDKKPSRLCRKDDVLSIKKYGRFKLAIHDRKTKSGKFMVTVQKYL